jgi:hypothetical protein
MGSYTGFKR